MRIVVIVFICTLVLLTGMGLIWNERCLTHYYVPSLTVVEQSSNHDEAGDTPKCREQILRLESMQPTHTATAEKVKINHDVRITNLSHATHQFMVWCGIDYADKPKFDALAIGVNVITVGPGLTKMLTITIDSTVSGTFFQPKLEIVARPYHEVEYLMVCNGGEWEDGKESEYDDADAPRVKFTLPVLLHKRLTDAQVLEEFSDGQ